MTFSAPPLAFEMLDSRSEMLKLPSRALSFVTLRFSVCTADFRSVGFNPHSVAVAECAHTLSRDVRSVIVPDPTRRERKFGSEASMATSGKTCRPRSIPSRVSGRPLPTARSPARRGITARPARPSLHPAESSPSTLPRPPVLQTHPAPLHPSRQTRPPPQRTIPASTLAPAA